MFKRHRRLRNNEAIRSLVRETYLTPNDFIYPIFVVEGENIKSEISGLPGNYHYSLDKLDDIISEISASGIKGILLFGIPDEKDDIGSSAFDKNGIVQKAIRKIKELNNDIYIITDICMCQYTDHGHCGIIEDGIIKNDKTLEYLQSIALSHVKAGADMVAPSDMMDGRIQSIREILDENGYEDTPIMAYSAKYASSFYGPFRDAAGSCPQFGDRKTYQMDIGNGREALREIEEDILEGADIVMVKPALSYLDVIRSAKDRFDYPLAAYNVSGEYAMVKAAGQLGYIDEKKIALEILTSIKRAGADIIITYFALDACKWIKDLK
ncbi:delta-aminolevulinic acid dehydratase HemB [Gottschalkia acidurici 9a]|uniref:Delta-aminolevulinic acid dehydratase n=1 Tax=Gottschalkia acidurici (strain ATCC 7906 / DSM 604 / BCRC 14475 / CIP 104303 / KCTC 5404 / NCIMB 10678 / 9a) TaxID=1128398 RepID=K0B3M3_GOTA9|nr:porphobilinogen synthase [Gottschalkia acidurici]AFS79460.1 delta-aminolevulinic acid dehydratase HemB [Gottschalkia acidurici 9a]